MRKLSVAGRGIVGDPGLGLFGSASTRINSGDCACARRIARAGAHQD